MTDDVKSMTQELARDPDSLVFLRLGEALRVRGQLGPAVKVASTGLERHPQMADAHDLYARILVDSGDHAHAFAVWEQALENDPRHQGSHKGLGFLYYRRGDLDAALDHLELALAADPTNQSVISAMHAVRNAVEDADESEADPRAGVFSSLEGGEHGMLLVDRQGRTLGGGVTRPDATSATDEVAAYLAGVSQEVARTTRFLQMGTWTWLVAEGIDGNVHLSAPTEDSVLFLVRDRGMPAGRLARLARSAAGVAQKWLEAQRL